MNFPKSEISIQNLKKEFSCYYQRVVELIENKTSRSRISNEEFMRIYGLIYKLLESASGENEYLMYQKICDEFDDLIKKHLENFLQTQKVTFKNFPNGVSCLSSFLEISKKHLIITRWIMKAFYYFEKREYSVTEKSIAKFSHDYLRNFVLEKFAILKKAITEVLDDDRSGNSDNKTLCKNVFLILNAVATDCDYKIELEITHNFSYVFKFKTKSEKKSEFYINYLENSILESSKSYYENHLKHLKLSPLAYISEMEKILSEEVSRAESLYPQSKDNLLDQLHILFISSQMNFLLQNDDEGFEALLKNENFGGIKAMYNFIAKIPEKVNLLSETFSNHIERKINVICSNKELEKNPIEFIKESLGFIKKVEEEIKDNFRNDQKIDFQVQNTLKNFFSKNNLIPKFLSFFVDFEFKKGIRGNSEIEIRNKIESISKFLSLIHSKDAFVSFHSVNLAKRLIGNLSLSIDCERDFIAVLKTIMGTYSLNKLEMMLNDFEDSKLISEQIFSTHKKSFKFEFCPKIITLSCWPESVSIKKWPMHPKLAEVSEKFESKYKEMYNGTRKLSWLLYEGFLEVQANFSKKYNLEISILQLFILNKLNSQNLTLNELISDEFAEAKEDFLIHIKQLEQAGIVKQEPASQMLLLSEEEYRKYLINAEFSSSNKKHNVVPKYRKALNANDAKVLQTIEKDREHIIDSVIVKTMKAKKKMETSELLFSLAESIQIFEVQPHSAKKRIEQLISREYLARDPSSPSILIYIP